MQNWYLPIANLTDQSIALKQTGKIFKPEKAGRFNKSYSIRAIYMFNIYVIPIETFP